MLIQLLLYVTYNDKLGLGLDLLIILNNMQSSDSLLLCSNFSKLVKTFSEEQSLSLLRALVQLNVQYSSVDKWAKQALNYVNLLLNELF